LPLETSPLRVAVIARGRPPGPRIASSAANPVGTTEPRTEPISEPTTEPTSEPTDSIDSTDSAGAPITSAGAPITSAGAPIGRTIGRTVGPTNPPLPQRSAPFPHFWERSEMAPSRASEGRAMRPVSIEQMFDNVKD
jgi:hypothetical protein